MDNADDYNGSQLIAISVTFLVLTYLSVILRCFVRIKITKAFNTDDWFMLVAQVNFTLSCSLILRGVHYGMGHHNMSLPQGERIEGLKYQALATLTYVSNMMFIKLSIAIFLLRIAVKKRYIWTLRISIAIVTIWSLAIFLYDIFQCTPVAAQWDVTITPSKCVSGDSFVSAAYSVSVMSILSDWMYAIMPIFMVWSIQMTAQKKFTVGIILSLGIFASVATLIRLKYLIELADYSDILYAGTTAMVWTLVEPGVAISAASLITIRPLLRALNFKGFDSTSPSGSHRTPYSGHHNLSLRNDIPVNNLSNSVSSVRRKDAKPFDMKTNLSNTTGLTKEPRARHEPVSDDNGSEEYILQGTNLDGITRTVDFTISNDARSLENGSTKARELQDV